MASQIVQIENVDPQIGNRDSIKQSQDEFVKAITDQVSKLLKTARKLDGPFKTINYPSGFYWGVQLAPNNYYNDKSLNQIDYVISEGINGTVTWGTYQFSNMYNQLLNAITYVVSKDDQAEIEADRQNFETQITSVIDSWEASMKEITDDKLEDIVPPSKIGYIENQVQELWSGDTRKIPNSLNDFKIAYQKYIGLAEKSHTILSRSAQGILQLQASRINTEEPTKVNGGMRTDDSSYFVGFNDIPHQSTINNGLKTTSNKISIKMNLQNFSSTECDLKVEGGAKVSVPIADILSFSIGASAQYDLRKYTSSFTSLDITMVYTGVTFIGSTPKPLSKDRKTGWYDNLILDEVVHNANKSNTVTGFQLQGHEFSVDEYFGEGKKFSRIKTLVISQQPIITIKFKNSEITNVMTDFKEKAKIKLNVLGFDVGGSVSEKFEISTVDNDKKTGVVTITLGPPEPVGTTPMKESTAYIIGGVASYPPYEKTNKEELQDYYVPDDTKTGHQKPLLPHIHVHRDGVDFTGTNHSHKYLERHSKPRCNSINEALSELDTDERSEEIRDWIYAKYSDECDLPPQ